MQSSIRLVYIIPLFLLSCKCINPPCEDDPEPVVEYAYPPLEMLGFFDFPVGSWWLYKCEQDDTYDSLIVIKATDSPIREDSRTGAKYMSRVVSYRYVNSNGAFNLGVFDQFTLPAGELDPSNESQHKLHSLYTSSASDHFNAQIEFFYPFDEANETANDSIVNVSLIDTLIANVQYNSVFLIRDAWINSSLVNYPISKIYKEKIGCVAFMLSNQNKYLLINFNTTP